jgi:hypothetical protein
VRIIRKALHISVAPIVTIGMVSLTCGLLGCTQGLRAPTYQPEAMAREAFRLYDTNKDGKLDASELKSCPSLADAVAILDTNNDKCIDEPELLVALKAIERQSVGLSDIEVAVTRQSRPVVGATLKLIPEPFMLGIIEPATGVSNASGVVRLQIEGQSMQGIRFGFYRAEVTHAGETIPAQYNTKTTLGKMVGYRWHGWQIRLD